RWRGPMNRGIPVTVLPLLLAAILLPACEALPEPDPASLPSHGVEPPSAAWRDAVDQGRSIARALVAEERLPGLSLAVAVEGKTVWAEGFGYADLKGRVEVTPATMFRIGGVSNSLTAAAAGLLSQRARLDLDAPV